MGPLERIAREHWAEVARIAGVSVGAVNGVMFAQNQLDVLLDLWNQVDGTDFFMEPSLAAPGPRGAGLFSLAPLGKKLRAHVNPALLQRSYSVGVCDFDTDAYRDLSIDARTPKEDAVDRILASSAQPVIMRGYRLLIGGEQRLCYDGGVRHVIPWLPADPAIDRIDVLLTQPAETRDTWKRTGTPTLLEIGSRALATYDDGVVLGGLLHLVEIQASLPPGAVQVWAPDKTWFEEHDPGGFEADRVVIQMRLAYSRTIQPVPIGEYTAGVLAARGLEAFAAAVRERTFARR
jgi:predicted acylesterase/phospholipase RssA